MAWKKTTAERFNEMLEILPPIDWTGDRFLVGEPMSHRDGAATYSAFVRIGDDYFESTEALTRAEFRRVVGEDILLSARQLANRARLVEALRSGRYRQATDNLRCTEGYCCLGVASELVDPNGWKPGIDGVFSFYDDGVGELQQSVMTAGVKDAFGFSDDIGTFKDEVQGCRALTELNDKGVPFADLADLIESNPSGLFVS